MMKMTSKENIEITEYQYIKNISINVKNYFCSHLELRNGVIPLKFISRLVKPMGLFVFSLDGGCNVCNHIIY